jgi:histidinol-phosphatase
VRLAESCIMDAPDELLADLDGNDVLSGNRTVLASNGHIHGALLELVRGVPSGRDYQSLMQARR